MKSYIRRLFLHLCLAILSSGALGVSADEVKIVKGDGKATVTIDGKFFTDYVFDGHSKPILYPIVGPTGVEMTRNYPMRENVDNEARDHYHHKSLWFTHDDVNGHRFWLERPEGEESTFGSIRQTSIKIKGNAIHTTNAWQGADGSSVCEDRRVVSFGATASGRYIDFGITITATHGDLKFGDTKEGTMGIRTHPLLRLTTDEKRGNHSAKGSAINSEGIGGKDIWGKRAKWVDYWAPIEGNTVGIAIFDHPDNPRHPTWWHARTYGLVAANPFGIHDFEKKPDGTGDLKIDEGEKISFQYRFLFHKGDNKEAKIEKEYEAFAKQY